MIGPVPVRIVSICALAIASGLVVYAVGLFISFDPFWLMGDPFLRFVFLLGSVWVLAIAMMFAEIGNRICTLDATILRLWGDA